MLTIFLKSLLLLRAQTNYAFRECERTTDKTEALPESEDPQSNPQRLHVPDPIGQRHIGW